MAVFDEILFDHSLIRKPSGEQYPVTAQLEFANSQPRNAQTGIRKTNVGRLDAVNTVTLDIGLLNDTERTYVETFIRGGQGSAVGFRIQLPHDYKQTTPETFATGTGVLTTFQLYKTYARPGETTHPDVRPIYKPVVVVTKETNSFQLYEPNAVTARIITYPFKIYFGVTEQTTGWTVNAKTGIVTFSVAPSNGTAIKWTGQFDTPMTFEGNTFTQHFDVPSGAQYVMREMLGPELGL